MSVGAKEIAEAIAAVNQGILGRLEAIEAQQAEGFALPEGLMSPEEVAVLKGQVATANERVREASRKIGDLEVDVRDGKEVLKGLDLETATSLLEAARQSHTHNLLASSDFFDRQAALLEKGGSTLQATEQALASAKAEAERAEAASAKALTDVVDLIKGYEGRAEAMLEASDRLTASKVDEAVAKVSTRARRDLDDQWAALKAEVSRTKQSLSLTRRHAKDAVEKALEAAEGYAGLTVDLEALRSDLTDRIDGIAAEAINKAADDVDLATMAATPWRGPWRRDETYSVGGLVMFRGSTWRAARANIGEEPAVLPGSPWDLFASAGVSGSPAGIGKLTLRVTELEKAAGAGAAIKADVAMAHGASVPDATPAVLFTATIPASWSGRELELRANISVSNGTPASTTWLEISIPASSHFQETICSHQVIGDQSGIGGSVYLGVVDYPATNIDQTLEVHLLSGSANWSLVNSGAMRTHMLVAPIFED